MPSLPSIVSALPPDLRNFLDRVRETVGNGSGRLVTTGDLVEGGIASQDISGNLLPPGGIITPPAPSNVVASGAMATVIIDWDDPTYRGHAYAEIWRAPTNDIGLAVLVGQSPGAVFSDSVGSGASNYYWVRFVSISNTIGPFNAALGVLGATSQDPEYLMSVLASTYGSAPFITIDTATVIDGVTIPAGVYIKAAYIVDGSITNAKIKNLAVDSAKISDAAITEAKIANASIGTAKIQTAAITNALIGLAAIGSANIQDAAITNAKIADATIDNAKIANATIDTAKIKDAAIGTAKIQAAAITEALIADAAIGSAKIQNASIGTAKIALASISTALIQNGAIQNALIGDAAISNAKIGDAQIDTLKVAGNSITVAGQATGTGWNTFYLNAPQGGVINIVACNLGGGGEADYLYVHLNGGVVNQFRGEPIMGFATTNQESGAGYEYVARTTPATEINVLYVGGGNHQIAIYSATPYRVLGLLTMR